MVLHGVNIPALLLAQIFPIAIILNNVLNFSIISKWIDVCHHEQLQLVSTMIMPSKILGGAEETKENLIMAKSLIWWVCSCFWLLLYVYLVTSICFSAFVFLSVHNRLWLRTGI